MMVDDQDLPVAAVLPKASNHTLAPIGNTDPATGPAKRIRPCVNRVGQDMMDGVINRQLPNQAAPSLIPSFQTASKRPPNDGHCDTVSAKRAISGVRARAEISESRSCPSPRHSLRKWPQDAAVIWAQALSLMSGMVGISS
jgi:hypothetical protein